MVSRFLYTCSGLALGIALPIVDVGMVKGLASVFAFVLFLFATVYWTTYEGPK